MDPTATHLLIAVWIFATGGAIGSFLNVVVYRLPAGLSLSWPGSFCPQCKHPIRWHDNVPVLGWILLRGRCRDCRRPIPLRYPAVEALVAGLYLLLGVVEGLGGAANLPVRPVPVAGGVIGPALGSAQVAGLLAWHLLLISTLLPAALIEYDGQRVPRRLFGPALVVGLVGSACWGWLHPVPAIGVGWRPAAGLLDALVGLVAGGLLGLAGRWLSGPKNDDSVPLAGAVVGLFLGWQAAVVIVVPSLAAAAVARAAGRGVARLGRVAPAAWMLAGSVAWLLCWQAAVRRWPLLG